MGQIYREAAKVWIWLGEDDGDAASVFAFLDPTQVNRVTWEALKRLFQWRWFSRRWVRMFSFLDLILLRVTRVLSTRCARRRSCVH